MRRTKFVAGNWKMNTTKAAAVEYVTAHSGTQFDPSVVGAFLRIAARGDLDSLNGETVEETYVDLRHPA